MIKGDAFMGLSLTGYNRFNPPVRFGEAQSTTQPQARLAQILSRAKGAGHGISIPTGNPNAKVDDVLAKVRAESRATKSDGSIMNASKRGKSGARVGLLIDYLFCSLSEGLGRCHIRGLDLAARPGHVAAQGL